jgi:isocitrate dehydrogenase (NAD+)
MRRARPALRTGVAPDDDRDGLRMPSQTHKVTLIPGDGVGPELTEATRRVLEAAAATSGSSFDWDRQEAGVDIMEEAGTPLPQGVLDSIRENSVAIKGPITTPIGTGFRSVNVALRYELELYACLRPCKTYPGVRTRFADDDVDLVVVRENTEDLYAGIEYEHDTEDANKVIEFLNGMQDKQIREHSGISIKPISEFGAERIIRWAFEYAQQEGRERVHCITKSNIMKHTDGLFLSVFREVAKDFPNIDPWENLIDATCMGLVQRPEEWDVLVTPNLYGDIVSDLTAGMVGGLGVAPGANFGTDVAVFEATHGSAPKYKGQNKVNPTAMILSGMLMLKHLGEEQAAEKLEKAVSDVIAEGKDVTYDLKPSRDDPSAVGTSEYADAIIAKLEG